MSADGKAARKAGDGNSAANRKDDRCDKESSSFDEEQLAIREKWGEDEVPGMSPERAEALGLQAIQLEQGYASSQADLHPLLAGHMGTRTRFLRHIAELLLQNSTHWDAIESRTRECKEEFGAKLATARVNEKAYSAAAAVMRKIMDRPSQVNVWASSCPALLRGKERDLALQTPGSKMYNEVLEEKMRMELVYEAVTELVVIAADRPVRIGDIESRYQKLHKRASFASQSLFALERSFAQELRRLGDGAEVLDAFDQALHASLRNGTLDLAHKELLSLPMELFQLSHVEILDLSGNHITKLPPAICQLTSLKKLYVNGNKITSMPRELHRMSDHLSLVSLADNPLNPETEQLYVTGLSSMMKQFRQTSLENIYKGKAGPRESDLFSEDSERVQRAELDLVNTTLPEYDLGDGPISPGVKIVSRSVVCTSKEQPTISSQAQEATSFEVDLAASRPAASFLNAGKLGSFAKTKPM